jgi:hypothetical protein
MRTIDRGINWGRRFRNYGLLSLFIGAAYVLVQSGLA